MISARRGKSLASLTGRDLELFCYLFEKKIADASQIARDIFFGVSRKTTLRRLKKLERLGLIEKHALLSEHKVRVGYRLLEKGLDLFRPNYHHDIDQARIKSDSPAHDLVLVDIDYLLSGFNCVDVIYTENMLLSCSSLSSERPHKDFAQLRSDRMVGLNLKNKAFNVAIEFERTRKNSERYRKKFEEYYASSAIGGVFYICANETLANFLMSIDERIFGKQDSKFFFATLSDCQNQCHELTFTNWKGAKITMS